MSRECKIDCSIQHQADTMRARSKEKSAANVESAPPLIQNHFVWHSILFDV